MAGQALDIMNVQYAIHIGTYFTQPYREKNNYKI